MNDGPPPQPQTLVFDLDGTLTDPFAGIARSYRHALTAIGRPHLDDQQVRDLIGPSLHAAFRDICRDDEHLIPAAIVAYRERYARIGLFENVVYPGIPAALRTLARSYELFVCTSKPTTFAKRILERFDLAHHFAGIYGAELDGTRGDKRELLGWLLDKERLVPRGTVLIGDRKYDIAAAAANGVEPIGVAWGFGTLDELQTAGAVTIVAAPGELPEYFPGAN